MTDHQRHIVRLSDRDISVIERSLRTRHGVIVLTGDMRSSTELHEEAELIAHTASLVQEHLHCDCESPKGSPPAREKKRPIPIEDRRVI